MCGPGDNDQNASVTDAIGSTGGYDNESHSWQDAVDKAMED